MSPFVDNLLRSFLHSLHFVTPGNGPKRVSWAVRLVFVAAVAGACSPQPASRTVEDSLTSGRIRIVVTPDVERLMVREIEAFERLYPEARVEIGRGSAREAIAALFGARADVAVIARELEPEEREAAVRGGLDVEGYRFARDAVVMVVHPGLTVENVSLEDVRGIYQGRITRWSQLGGADVPVVPVVQRPGADVTTFLVEEALQGEAMTARAIEADGDSAIVAAVSRTPGAVGYVSLQWSARGARALRLARVVGLPYWKADAETVYRGEYPLTRYFNLYARTSGPQLAHGVITFVTGREGQQLVHESGAVPTTVPVRFVRRSPMKSTH